MSGPVAGGAIELTSGLAERLRSETRTLHATVERQGVMGQMLRGGVELPVYCRLLRNLHAIYQALEAALTRHHADPCVAEVYAPALQRAPGLAADLDELDLPGWRSQPLAAATEQYVQRLKDIEATGSRAVIAHAYVRYLGDLAGGQVLRKLVAARFGLAGGQGTHFYEFGSAEVVGSLLRGFREGLDRMPVSAHDAELIVAEARAAFLRHGELFEQLVLPAPG